MIYQTPERGNEKEETKIMAKKKAAKKTATRSGKPASVLPGMPDNFVVMGLSTAQNKRMAAAIRKKLASD